MSGVDGAPPRQRVSLTEAQRDAADRGLFVRVDLPAPARLGDGTRAASLLVARVGGAMRAFANVCRHQAVPLDARAEEELTGAMADDGRHLVCLSHGALYRPDDGMCVSGPCLGERLVAIPIDDRDGALEVTLPAGPLVK